MNFKAFIIKILEKTGVLNRLNLDLKLSINNRSFRVPINKSIGINNHRMDELWMMDLFSLLQLPNNTPLIDLGANIGQSLLKWKAYFPKNPYIGIEPLEKAYQYTSQLIEENKMQLCDILNCAITDIKGSQKLNLHFDDLTDRTASLVPGPFKIKSYQITECNTLADIFNKYPQYEFNNCILKIDVEGSEAQVISSSYALIEKHKPFIILEIISSNYNSEILKTCLIPSYQWVIRFL